MSKHTPGPWELNGGENGEWEITAKNSEDNEPWYIGATYGCVGHGLGDSESDSNARLIAAAPDLLEALQDAWLLLHGANSGNFEFLEARKKRLDDIRRAIARATGEA